MGIGELFELDTSGKIEDEARMKLEFTSPTGRSWNNEYGEPIKYYIDRPLRKDDVNVIRDYRDQYNYDKQPCAMDAAYDAYKKAGGKDPFSIMLVCSCPKCRLNCGSL